MSILINNSILGRFFPKIDLINFSGYVGYAVLGYYLSVIEIKRKYLFLTPLLLGVIITYVGTYYMSNRNNQFTSYFYEYLSINVMLASIGFFIFFKSLNINSSSIKAIITNLSNKSYGIYLVHILVLTTINIGGINWNMFNPIISIHIISVICFGISWFVIFLMQKNKYLKYISG